MGTPIEYDSEILDDVVQDDDVRRQLDDYFIRSQHLFLMDEKAGCLDVEDETVTIHFAKQNGEVFSGTFQLYSTFRLIKEQIAVSLNVPPCTIRILGKDVFINDQLTPSDLGAAPSDEMELDIRITDGSQWPLAETNLQEDREYKPFLGGYRHRLTGLQFLHAATQAKPEPKVKEKYTRDTQTNSHTHKATETPCEKSTQSGEIFNLYEFQRIVTPRPFRRKHVKSFKELNNAAKIIQRNYRVYILKKYIRLAILSKWEEMREFEEKEEKRINYNIQRMTYPKTKADFDMLYSMVERWRKAQTERVAKLKTNAPKRAELCFILEKEVKLLESIEAHRIRRTEEKRKEREKRFLKHISQPISWTGYKGVTISMDTIKTQRARELAGIYDQLSEFIDPSNRINQLSALKHAISNEETATVRELIQLVNREIELLVRATPQEQLQFLRERIQQLFFKYFKETETIPAKPEPHLYCRLCCNMRSRRSFNISARDTDVTVCSHCRISRGNALDYRHLLRLVRRDEQRLGCYSSCAFVMTDEDMEFLVSVIWHRRSIVSEVEELRVLRFPRYDVKKDWTPWNCILLTEREARAHVNVPHQVQYAEHTRQDIITKHELAKQRFAQLLAVDKRLRDSGIWANVTDTSKK